MTISTSNNKRKGAEVMSATQDDGIAVASTSMLGTSSGMDMLRNTLQELRNRENQQTDPFAIKVIEQCQESEASLQEQINEMIQSGKDIAGRLENQIEETKEERQEESNILYDLEMKKSSLSSHRDSLVEDLAELDQVKADIRQRIAELTEIANQEIEKTDQVEEERKNQVPRLKHQISLYAATTGFKWNYADERLVAGEVAVPSAKVVKSFSIDPQDYDSFELANKLWELRESF